MDSGRVNGVLGEAAESAVAAAQAAVNELVAAGGEVLIKAIEDLNKRVAALEAQQ